MKKYLFVSSLVLIILAMTSCEKNNSGKLTGYWGSKQYIKNEEWVDLAGTEDGDALIGMIGLHFIDKNTVEYGWITAYKSYVGSTSKYTKLCSEKYRGYNIVYAFGESLGIYTYEKQDNKIYTTKGDIFTLTGNKLYSDNVTYYMEKLSE